MKIATRIYGAHENKLSLGTFFCAFVGLTLDYNKIVTTGMSLEYQIKGKKCV